MSSAAQVVAISGGVGGAKLALGLQRVLPAGALAVLVNTGDDFRHLGLAISPDLDTVLYTLAGLAHPTQGWGRADETWQARVELERLGGPSWFALGDRDLALHLERTRLLTGGATLSAVTARLAARFGVSTRLWPMSDDTVRTVLDTDAGTLEFQQYFVQQRCAPVVRAIRYVGATTARPLDAALEAIARPGLDAIVLCPSNPYLSIDPMLAMPALRAALQRSAAPVIAVSPLVGGRAVKGPTSKLMQELRVPATPGAIARHYAGVIDGLVVDSADAALCEDVEVPTFATDTLMTTLGKRDALATATLAFAARLRRAAPRRSVS